MAGRRVEEVGRTLTMDQAYNSLTAGFKRKILKVKGNGLDFGVRMGLAESIQRDVVFFEEKYSAQEGAREKIESLDVEANNAICEIVGDEEYGN